MKKLIAYCGLDCEKCEARIATLNNDNALRQKVAKLWSKMNEVKITPEMVSCEGCRVDGVKTPFCNNLCPIRKCAQSKKLKTCGDCLALNDCQIVSMVISNNLEALENLKTENTPTEI